MVGGMANMPGLASYAREALQLPAKTGVIQSAGGFIDTVNAPEYATSVGLMILDMLLSEGSNQGFLSGPNDGRGLINKFKNLFS